MKVIPGGVTAAGGFHASGMACGIKKSGKPDLALLYSVAPALGVGAFTQNRFAAAPVEWCRRVLSGKQPLSGVIVNSGVANAITGRKGMEAAVAMAGFGAKALQCQAKALLVASTGVIGKQLPLDKIAAGVPQAKEALSQNGGGRFARAIMTTDLVPKEYAVRFKIRGIPVTIGGCCKGSGMIQPNMATLLAFITTDANISLISLKKAFRKALAKSFNRITVDGDTSTNDSLILLANRLAGNPVITNGPAFDLFTKGLTFVFTELAKMVVRDGEGATKLAVIRVKGARTESDADKTARRIANSPLVKTALFGNDPNWGRLLCAAGNAGISFEPSKVRLTLCGIKLVDKGEPLAFDTKKANILLKRKEVDITVDLGSGKEEAEVFTCDFSYDYVKINAEYHT